MTRKPKNTSNIEVIAYKNEIEELLSKGFNYSLIFRKLYEENKITCKYHAFLKTAKIICNSNLETILNKKNKEQNINQTKKTPHTANPSTLSSRSSENKTDKEKFENENKELSDLA